MTTRTTRRTQRATRGFTLLELMVVIVIIGILGGVLTLNLVGASDRARERATKSSMESIQAALTMYKVEYSNYPTTGMGLQTLQAENFFTEEMKDSWGTSFEYYSPGQFGAYELISAGADQQFETVDDIIVTPPEEGG